MINDKKIVLGMLVVFTFILSCKKDSNYGNGDSVKGNLSVEVHVMHHSWDVSGIMVYLKKNATEFPGQDSSIYDFKGQADGYGKISFENLLPGKYYVYASGYDSVWGSHVIGYSPLSLYSSNLVNNHAELTLLVSE